MASPAIYLNGLNLAGTVFANGPDTLQRGGAVFFSGAIQFVDTTGGGSDSNAGNLPELPVATLAQAVTNSTTNGIIVIGEGSSENISGGQVLSLANLSLFGCGVGSSRPRYTCTGAVVMFEVNTNGGVWIEGFYFPASTAAATARVSIATAGCTVKDCYFECGANDTNRALLLTTTSANQAHIEGCSFVTTASRPAIGLQVAAAVVDPTIVDCTFNGGSYGWSDYALKVSAAATRIRILGGTYSNRSDIGITVTATSYELFGIDMDGTSNVLLTA